MFNDTMRRMSKTTKWPQNTLYHQTFLPLSCNNNKNTMCEKILLPFMMVNVYKICECYRNYWHFAGNFNWFWFLVSMKKGKHHYHNNTTCPLSKRTYNSENLSKIGTLVEAIPKLIPFISDNDNTVISFLGSTRKLITGRTMFAQRSLVSQWWNLDWKFFIYQKRKKINKYHNPDIITELFLKEPHNPFLRPVYQLGCLY